MELTAPRIDNNSYLIRSKPNQDLRAAENLRQQGWTCFNPVIRVNKSKSSRTRMVTEPLFPGYIFVKAGRPNIDYRAVTSTRGVIGFVRFGSYPAIVPDAVIDEIRERVSDYDAQRADVSSLKRGCKVRLLDSGLEGIEAIFLSPCDKERSMILIKLISRDVKTKVYNHQIEPLVP